MSHFLSYLTQVNKRRHALTDDRVHWIHEEGYGGPEGLFEAIGAIALIALGLVMFIVSGIEKLIERGKNKT